MDYAIDARDVRPIQAEVTGILDLAARAGIRVLDTASAYGDAEQVVGKALGSAQENANFRIITKTAPVRNSEFGPANAAELTELFRRSLRHLGVSSVYGLLIHKADSLLAAGGQRLFEVLEALRGEGCVTKIGVSVYTADQIDRITDRYPIEIIQVPVSLLDQRLIASGHLAALKRAGIEIHARSVFLKGLIFAEPDSLPPHFDTSKETLVAFRNAAAAAEIKPGDAALSYILDIPEIDTVLVGVTHTRQLAEILDGLNDTAGSGLPDPQRFALTDPDVLNPGRWPEFQIAVQ